MEINSILEGQTIPWIDDVDIAVSASELLGIVGQDTPSKQDSGSMWAWGNSPCTNRAHVGLTGSATYSLDPHSCILAIPHPVVEDHGHGCWDVHEEYLVLPACSMLTGDLWGEQNIARLPLAKPCRVPVGWWVLLPEDVAGDVLRYLKESSSE